jgi:predicted nucleic acid-binding protein
MTNIFGNKKVIVDSDALIGLIHKDDSLHKRCFDISEFLSANGFSVVVPYPIVLEAATALAKDKTIRRPDLAARLLKDHSLLRNGDIDRDNVNKLVSRLYNPKTSRRNSPFDYYLLAVAKLNDIDLVFSFDLFYRRQGLRLVESIVKTGME